MKKLIFLITVFVLLFSFNKAEAQRKLQTGVPMVVFSIDTSVDTLTTDTIPVGDNIIFSKIDATYSVQVVTDTMSAVDGTQDGKVIRQYSNDGVNFVDIDTLQLVDDAEANDITTFTGTSWTQFYLRFRYTVETADTTDLDITIYAIPNK